MMHYDDETLAGVALGEEDDPALWAHLQVCQQCSGSLATLQRTLSVATASGVEQLRPPPPDLWGRIETQVATDPVRRRRTAPWIVLALAAGVAIGAVGTTAVSRSDSVDPVPVVIARTQLDAPSTNRPVGTAEVFRNGTGIDLRLDAGPVGGSTGYLEVWLINRDLARTVSIGILSPRSTSQTFVISQRLLDQGYVIVDVSRESFDAKSAHSGDTLFRGTLHS